MVLPIVRTAEWFQGTVLRREPTLPSEPVRMATTRMEYDDDRAREELGYSSSPARDALARAARWYVDNGFVKDAQVRRIRDAGRLGPEIDLRDDVVPIRESERRP
jgi:dihydroflavonol-4-reductase